MTQSMRLVVAIEYQKDKIAYIEIDNYRVDKTLWEVKSMFDPILANDILLVYADYQYVSNKDRLPEKQRDDMLIHIKNKYYTDLKRRNEKLEVEKEYYLNIIKKLQDELKKKGNEKK